jgi:hypothetical protein
MGTKLLAPLRWLVRLLPHLCIAMSVSLLVLVFIDHFNNAMGFLEGAVFNWFLLIYLSVAAATAGLLLFDRSRR